MEMSPFEMTPFEKTLNKKRLQQQKTFDFCADVLENLLDESSKIETPSTGAVMFLPIDKLNFVIEELNEIKHEVELLDSVEFSDV